MNVRVAPGGLRDLGVVNWLVCRGAARAAGTDDVRLFRTLGRHRRLFRGWLMFAASMMPRGSLPRAETELVILRVAARRRCDYEIDHHVRIARRAGVARGVVDDVLAGRDAGDTRLRAILHAVDALVTDRALDEPTWAVLRDACDEREIIELCMLVGHYEMLATMIAALGIGRDFCVGTSRCGS